MSTAIPSISNALRMNTTGSSGGWVNSDRLRADISETTGSSGAKQNAGTSMSASDATRSGWA